MKRTNIYDKCKKEGTFLKEFCDLCKSIPTPEIFDFWQGMYMLSSLTDRHLAIEVDDKLYFPNLYTMFISDNSSIFEDAQTVLEDVERLHEESNHTFINTYTSPNSFVAMLSGRSDVCKRNCIRVAVSSMNVFCRSKDCVNMLTDLYSCPVTRSGYDGKNKYTYGDVFITFNGKCCASDYFNNVDKNFYDNEFLARVITIAANKTKIPEKGKYNNYKETTKLIDTYKKKIQTPVFLTYEPFAIRVLKRFARNNSSKRYGARPYELAIKLSGLLAFNERSETITTQHVKDAYKLIEAVTRQLNIFITKREFEESNRQYNDAIKKILSIISASGENGIGHFEVYQKVRYYITNEEFSQIMAILFEYGFITKYMHMNGKATIYAPNDNTDKLDAKKSVQIIKLLLSSD